MDDVVAVAVALDSGDERYFLTWGRIQDPVDPSPLEAIVLEHSRSFSLGGDPVRARLCDSLKEASGERYFHECFFDLCQRQIPFGEATYQQWRQETDRRMRLGKEIWYLGRPNGAT